MSKIVIKATTDVSDCEDCGGGLAQGADVYIDGELVIHLEPVAHCYDSISYEPEDVLRRIILQLGHSIEYQED